ncbi:unnamed protein product [Blepharisma stoltei]|uniref:Purple acid phosphatase n=1 Tax=Blepharisma stoltei TaxID=1481888 RepID=A0AAU9IM40_9CILI|nr:unnamed protein product [Blepharisma stoltei]
MDKKFALLIGFIALFFINIIFIIYYTDAPKINFNLLSRTKKIEQVHIALGSTENSMNIMWVMKDDPENCWVDIEGIKVNFTMKSPLEYFGNTGKHYKRFFYTAIINDLIPGHHYSYQVICIYQETLTYSAKFVFKGPPDKDSKITAISFGDFQTNSYPDPADNYSKSKRANILSHLLQESKSLDWYDLLLHSGDISYDLWSYNGLMADHYMQSIEYFAARFPYMTVPGNHESYTNFTHYKALFKPIGEGLYYSFNLGQAHFLMIDSESFVGRFHTQKMLDDQMDFIKSDLENNQQRWTVIISHRPIYCSPNPDCRVCMSACTQYCHVLSKYLEDLLIEYHVDLYIAGDVHLYERTLPVYKNETMQYGKNIFENPPAPIYIVNGVGGSFDREDDPSRATEEPMVWSVSIDECLGYGKLIIHNATHLQWTQYGIGKTLSDPPDFVESAKPRKIDEFFIIKNK